MKRFALGLVAAAALGLPVVLAGCDRTVSEQQHTETDAHGTTTVTKKVTEDANGNQTVTKTKDSTDNAASNR